ncbi:MAG: SIMPL domain-containing protein [Candidatus Taylorbacteria bacterium]|nr:SIMPL domain-containing protein [Candidatus Taylorbacteria bacterium]
MDTLNNSVIRKGLGTLLIILVAFVAIKIVSEVKSLSYIGKPTNVPNVITVNGKGEVIATPDIATFSFTVSEESPVVSTAQAEATKKMNSILAYLQDTGVEDKDVKTVAYDIYPRYDYVGNTYYGGGKQVLAAYVVSQTIQVKVREMAKAGDLLTGIGEYGASNVSGLTFSVDEQDELLREARDKAITDAREQAEKLAKSLGVKLGSITSYYDNSPYQPYPMYYAKDGMGSGVAMNQAAPQLPGGESKIISNVTITYEIK